MGFWGWRQAAWMAFISVLVVACTESAPIPSPAPTQTSRPLTLTLQGSSGAPPATPRPTLSAVTATPSESDPAPVEVLPPQCSDTVNDGYQCLGLARNTGAEPQGTILLYAELYDRGEIVESGTLVLEQRLLAADSAAPYRLIFEHSAEGPLVLGLSGAFAPDERLTALTVTEQRTSVEGRQYSLYAVIINLNTMAVTQGRVVGALYAGDRLLGFHAVDIESLASGESLPVEMHWYDIAPGTDYHHTLAADGITQTE